MRRLSLDPGVRAVGWALWSDVGRLLEAGCSRAPKHYSPSETVAHHSRQIPSGEAVIVEEMVWRHGDVRSQSRDLLTVQLVGCTLAGILSSTGIVVHLPAAEWKGRVPKNIHHPRIVAALTDGEPEVLSRGLEGVPKTNRKEVLDAVGIGLYHLDRIDKAGRAR